jgi:hypothetical protein
VGLSVVGCAGSTNMTKNERQLVIGIIVLHAVSKVWPLLVVGAVAGLVGFGYWLGVR